MATNIANKVLSYLRAGRTGRVSPNTTIESYYGGYLVRLHGNAIIKYNVFGSGLLEITMAGWATRTTSDRLAGVYGGYIPYSQKHYGECIDIDGRPANCYDNWIVVARI